MTFLEDMDDAVGRLRVFGELDVAAAELPGSVLGLSDGSVRDALAVAAGLARQVGVLQSVLAGVAAVRSSREKGHGGLVQGTGHRNAVEFIRDLTGATRGEAIRTVKVGEALLDGVVAGGDGPSGAEGEGDVAGGETPARMPWHEPVRVAVLSGAVTTAQANAIRAGLGEPPESGDQTVDEMLTAWRAAAAGLVREAPLCTVEDLASRARCLRDMLDPAGAERRFQDRFLKRSYRSYRDADGQRHARIVYDDEMGEWVDHLLRTALAPRRGGPRFVSDDERAAAEELSADPRSNEQLSYDLLMDVLRTGAFADAKAVYGAKRPGLRLITMKDSVTGATAHRDAFGRLSATACAEDGGLVLPGSVLEHALCMTGTIDLLTDSAGNPLDLGREARLYSARQKLTIAARDGGCRWPGCDRPPEYCESHHIDPWAEGGETDVDRGILLCRFHHLHLHHTGWRITREGQGPFVLHPPPGEEPGGGAAAGGGGSGPIILESRSPLRWLWDPPPARAPWRRAA